jgi:hypothetical protein
MKRMHWWVNLGATGHYHALHYKYHGQSVILADEAVVMNWWEPPFGRRDRRHEGRLGLLLPRLAEVVRAVAPGRQPWGDISRAS